MRQLDTCDFCGDPSEGVYEVVPASVADDPKRLALCADCRGTLQTVVDPLLDAANETATTEPTDDPSPAVEGNARSVGTDSGTAIDDAISDAAEAASEATTKEAAAESSAASDPDADDGVTIDAGDDSDVVDSGSVDDESRVAADDEDTADASEPAAGGSPARRPDGYAQIVRLLQNRDGAMPREDLRALATNAYDLGGSEFEAAVDAAVENGDVEETADGLRTA